jgi:DNA adenine methylase
MQTISDAKRGDFVYMDPPFAVKKSRVFAEYQAKPFGSTDVERLRTTMQSLERKNVKFLVSYLECDEAKYLSRSFDVRRVQVRRHISGFAGARSRSFELLISN